MGRVAEPSDRSGRHSVPRHAAPRTSRSDEPVRFDSRHLPTVRRPGEKPRRQTAPLLLLALGITATVVAWGYLVYLAIDFGTTARNGDSTAWWFLALATVGAIACLFVAMMLGTRLVNRIRAGTPPTVPPPTPGGRRAAR
jgi:hypothetical protein